MEDREIERKTLVATLCAGSFWDTEAVFRHIQGVITTSVGFMGGTVTAPTYEEVSTGKTGHSEVVMIAYDPDIITYRELLNFFFNSHDPCTKQQGVYAGSQYDPVIFYHNENDKHLAEQYMQELCRAGRCHSGIITRTVPASTFYRADECHQQFYEKMGSCYTALNTGTHENNE